MLSSAKPDERKRPDEMLAASENKSLRMLSWLQLERRRRGCCRCVGCGSWSARAVMRLVFVCSSFLVEIVLSVMLTYMLLVL